MRTADIGVSLQHPRRSLGNRYRSQAEKFFKLNEKDITNLSWAEQSARQAVLHDFTHPDNWRILLEIKVSLHDNEGIRSVLDEVFLILGRDPELLSQINKDNLLDSASNLLEAALSVDPLDPDDWWNLTMKEGGVEGFCERIRRLDFTDPRANILFSRRMERLLEHGFEEEYLDLTKKLLAQRPSNHEAWDRMGKLHERRNEYDLAWFCYDQAQAHSTSLKSREEFRKRMEDKIDGRTTKPWKSPDISDRVEFLTRMQSLAENKHQDTISSIGESTEEQGLTELQIAEELLTKDGISEAFFIARRLAAEGDSEAKSLAERIQEMMRNE